MSLIVPESYSRGKVTKGFDLILRASEGHSGARTAEPILRFRHEIFFANDFFADGEKVEELPGAFPGLTEAFPRPLRGLS
jgi:hypothetical protein